MVKKSVVSEKLLIYLVFFTPVIQIILFFTQNIFLIKEFTILHYGGIILISTYVVIFRKKLFSPLLFIFLGLYTINIFFSSNYWISFRDIMPINIVINLSLIFFSGKFSLVHINTTFKKFVFIIILLGFFSFVFGLETMSSIYTGNYHAGLFGKPHTAAYSLLTILIYTILVDKSFNLFAIFSILGVLVSGVRTVIIALIIFLISYILIESVVMGKIKSKQVRHIFISIILLSIFLSLFGSPIVGRIQSRFLDLAPAGDFSSYGSGRGGIALSIFGEFKTRTIFQVLFGKPLESVYSTTQSQMGVSLWAHNDFLMVLAVLGCIGFLIYLYFLFIYPSIYLVKVRENKQIARKKHYNLYVVLIVILILALGNGFYYYYSAYLLLYVISLVANDQADLRKKKVFDI